MVMTQAQWSSLLTPVIYHHLDIGGQSVPQLREQLYNVQGSNVATEYGTGVGGMNIDAWDSYSNDGVKGRLDFDQLYTETYTHVEYPVELVLKKQLIMNDQYGIIGRAIQKAGLSAQNKMEVDAASLLNNAFSGSFLQSDGDPLCSTSHPRGPNTTTADYSNSGTTALSKTAVKDTRVLMSRFKDDKGNEIGVMADELWVPPELEDTALEIVNSTHDPGNANNAVNTQAGRYTVKPWHRLTDTNNWFMVSSAMRRMAVNWYNRENMTVMLVHETTTELVWEIKLHYSFGSDDWRWIYGHAVT